MFLRADYWNNQPTHTSGSTHPLFWMKTNNAQTCQSSMLMALSSWASRVSRWSWRVSGLLRFTVFGCPWCLMALFKWFLSCMWIKRRKIHTKCNMSKLFCCDNNGCCMECKLDCINISKFKYYPVTITCITILTRKHMSVISDPHIGNSNFNELI